jgi:two-component system, chemotaxis family, sensor kinase CheA
VAQDRFLNMFFEEARELLQALEAGLMDMEARQDDRAHLDRTFRAAHTLKGAAGMVGLSAIAGFTHDVEAILDRIRGGQLAPRAEIISTLLKAKDYLNAAIEAQALGDSTTDPPDLVAKLRAIASGAALAEAEPPRADEPSSRIDPRPTPMPPAASNQPILGTSAHYRIEFSPSAGLLKRGVNPLGMLDELRELGTATIQADFDRLPVLDLLTPTDLHLGWTIDLETAASRERIDEVFLFLDEPGQVVIERIEASAAAPIAQAAADSPAAARTRTAGPARVRVDSEQLDALIGMAGELAVLTDTLQGLQNLEGVGPWAATLEALERVGHRLRDTTLELRMVPVEELFLRFPRVVRDMAERWGKKIAVVIEGEETRLDRTIIERLSDPMVHLIRNAVDHGLETPEERASRGKPPTGTLRISASYEGDRVAITIEDDGRGLDRAKILKKGIAAGLLPPETPLDDPRVGGVIFEPGFSTRDEVGELSGRGVGLDVVRDAIRGLRGSVTLKSVEGKGTKFLIRLPLTLAMIDGLLIESDGGRFVVPMGQVDECVAVSADDPRWSLNRSALVVRGEFVPLVSLRRELGREQPFGDRQELLLTRHAEQRVGVAVDRLLGRVQAVTQPLGEGLGDLRRYSGATILGDGSICLILDLMTLVSEAQAHHHSYAASN